MSTENCHRNESGLKIVLRANAAFSMLSGLFMVLGASTLARWMGLAGTKDLTSIGISLLLFAPFLLWLTSKPRVNRVLAWMVVAGDISWVAMSFRGLAANPGVLTEVGRGLVTGAALAVAFFAAGQMLFLLKSRAKPKFMED